MTSWPATECGWGKRVGNAIAAPTARATSVSGVGRASGQWPHAKTSSARRGLLAANFDSPMRRFESSRPSQKKLGQKQSPRPELPSFSDAYTALFATKNFRLFSMLPNHFRRLRATWSQYRYLRCSQKLRRFPRPALADRAVCISTPGLTTFVTVASVHGGPQELPTY
jgi:hypothetical protein